ncbi:MAG: AAA family ATPase [Candidatus Aenigmatarchaeota archaeon]|nr:MAG: AAA family ATPase [Candidatus Aenigmarchaeota archaeon]
MAERITSGVIGLDEKIGGGFVKGSVNLITGKTGTGKTAFCAAFLYAGAQNGEPGVYITTEESVDDIRADVTEMFGWDLESLEKKKAVKIISLKPIFPTKAAEDLNRLIRAYISNLLDDIVQAVKDTKAKRLIIDSESMIELFVQDEYLAKVALMSMIEKIKETGVTAIITGTIPEESEGLSGSGVVEFIVDTVIKLDFVPVAEEYKRTLTVRKMRRTDHSTLIHPFTLGKQGVQVVEIE